MQSLAPFANSTATRNGGMPRIANMPHGVTPRSRALVPSGKNALKATGRKAVRFWVLHRRLLLIVMAALFTALFAAAAFQMRGGIMATGTTLGHVLSGRFAAAGFGITQISISGQLLTREREVANVLAIDPQMTIFEFDAEAARERLTELPTIDSVRISKVYPSQLVIEITEIEPVARWRVDGVTFLIDAEGNQLTEAHPAETALPLVIGDGAADDAAVIISVLKRYPALEEDLMAISRIADRRWDFIYRTGLRIKLPEAGVAQAMELLMKSQAESQILQRDLDVIDLRVPGLMALTVTAREDES